MRAWRHSGSRWPAVAADAGLVAVAAADLWFNHLPVEAWWDHVVLAVGVLALMLRRRHPLAVFAATLPMPLLMGQSAASLIALFTVACATRNRWLLTGCALVYALFSITTWWGDGSLRFDSSWLVWGAYALAPAGAAVFLGQLVQTKRELSRRLEEISEVREHEQALAAQKVLAQERAHLAREMHDVVSHQVSLIAVRAGALQVSTREPIAQDAADTIQTLAARTLDELRHMVGVLRAGGGGEVGLAPQPTLAGLGELVRGAGVEAELHTGPLPDLSPPVQRAIYRTVQEALTNARKHAPGAAVRVRVAEEDGAVLAEVMNTPPTRAVVPLPSAKHGLIGLEQRAELLRGTFEAAPTADGGWRVALRVPSN
ncbi:two-component sensor histidine kinase [Glycomyces terrestris]|uniref:histidine kinase n=1 Tax=Glycomyces terrestris TaxID=2493553 RepID=A0A426V1Z4_9ACTN|nr:two-component sensor histidine kinase [Glycomyces terrestris]